MNDDKYSGDLHAWIEPEIEARVVALILGEASAFEAEELERLMEERPEIRIFKRRLEAVHGLIGEVCSPQDDEEWQLAPERRAELFEALELGPDPKVVAVLDRGVAAREKRIRRAGRRMMWGIAACLALTLFLFVLVSPLLMRDEAAPAASRALSPEGVHEDARRYLFESRGESAQPGAARESGKDWYGRVAGETDQAPPMEAEQRRAPGRELTYSGVVQVDAKAPSSIRSSLARMKQTLGEGGAEGDDALALGDSSLTRRFGELETASEEEVPAAAPVPTAPPVPNAAPAKPGTATAAESGDYIESTKGRTTEKEALDLGRGGRADGENKKKESVVAANQPAGADREFNLAVPSEIDAEESAPSLEDVPLVGRAVRTQPVKGPEPTDAVPSPASTEPAPDAASLFARRSGVKDSVAKVLPEPERQQEAEVPATGGAMGGGGGGFADPGQAEFKKRGEIVANDKSNLSAAENSRSDRSGLTSNAERLVDMDWADMDGFAGKPLPSRAGQRDGDVDGDGLAPAAAGPAPNPTWSIAGDPEGARLVEEKFLRENLEGQVTDHFALEAAGEARKLAISGGMGMEDDTKKLFGTNAAKFRQHGQSDGAASEDLSLRIEGYETASRNTAGKDPGVAGQVTGDSIVPSSGVVEEDGRAAGTGDAGVIVDGKPRSDKFGWDGSTVAGGTESVNGGVPAAETLYRDFVSGNEGGKADIKLRGVAGGVDVNGVLTDPALPAEPNAPGGANRSSGRFEELAKQPGHVERYYDRPGSDQTRAKLLKEVDESWEEAVPSVVGDTRGLEAGKGASMAVSGAGGYTTFSLDSKNLAIDPAKLESVRLRQLEGQELETLERAEGRGRPANRGSELLSALSATLGGSEKSVEDQQAANHWAYTPPNTVEVQRKLNEIILPEVDLDNVTVTEALAYLQEQAQQLDVNELDEAKKGLDLSVRAARFGYGEQVRDEELDAEGGLGAADPSTATVKDLKLRNVPLGTVLGYIADQTRTRYRVEGDAVTLVPMGAGEGEDVLTQAFAIPEPVWKKIQGGEKPAGLMDSLRDYGIDFPPGATANYVSSSGTLVVSNTPQNLELVESLVANTTKSLERESEALKALEKNASEEAFSTFSLHVSDVSFKLAKASLAQGVWPEAEKIRVEEFVNAFDYGDPAPTQDEKVACALEQAAHPFMQQRNLLRVSMRTAALGRSAGTPLRLTVLLDNSGSMERADRVESVKNAFNLLAAQLNPQDQITLISFARAPRLVADRVIGEDARQLATLVDNIPSEGGTNLEEALRLGVTKAKEQFLDGGQNRIILLTDGAANLGNAKPAELGTMVEEMRQQGIAFDACGVGAEGLNDDILESLTRKGDGRYYFLDNPEDADEGFAKQIAGALRPAAKNVKVQVEFNPKRVGRYKLYGFEKHLLKKEDFRNDSVDAAELAAEEAGNAIYQFEAMPEGEGEIGTVSVRFQDTSSGQMVEKKWTIPYDAGTPRLDDAQPSMRLASGAALLGEKLKGSIIGEGVEMDRLTKVVSDLPGIYPADQRVKDLMEMTAKVRELSAK